MYNTSCVKAKLNNKKLFLVNWLVVLNKYNS